MNHLESLKLVLFERALHPELFDIYDEIKVCKPSWDTQIWITGCRHVVMFSGADHTLTEVIADDSVVLPQRGLVLSLPFKGEKSHERRTNGGIHYMMNFQSETMSPRVYRKSHQDLMHRGETCGALIIYPQWTTRETQGKTKIKNPLAPFSQITCDSRPNGLHIMAFHAYPDERTIIKTQSIFELG
ncbi:MAG: DUF2617 family protein [Phycisphaerae bacterium]|nr:DUF2617 family protein [Phycisphaerae bacterium]